MVWVVVWVCYFVCYAVPPLCKPPSNLSYMVWMGLGSIVMFGISLGIVL